MKLPKNSKKMFNETNRCKVQLRLTPKKEKKQYWNRNKMMKYFYKIMWMKQFTDLKWRLSIISLVWILVYLKYERLHYTKG